MTHILSRSSRIILSTTLCTAGFLGQMGCPSQSTFYETCEAHDATELAAVVQRHSIDQTCLTILIENTELENLDALRSLDFYYDIELRNNPKLTDLSALEQIRESGGISLKQMPLGETYTFTRAETTKKLGYIELVDANTRVVNITALGTSEIGSVQLFALPNLEEVNLDLPLEKLHQFQIGTTSISTLPLESLRQLDSLLLTNNPNLPIQPIQAFLDTLPEGERPEFTHCGNADDEACPPPPEEPEFTLQPDQN